MSDQVAIAIVGAVAPIIGAGTALFLAVRGTEQHSKAGTQPGRTGPRAILPPVDANRWIWVAIGAFAGLLIVIGAGLLVMLAGVGGPGATVSPSPSPSPTPAPTAPPTPRPTAVDLNWMTGAEVAAREAALISGRPVNSKNGTTCVSWAKAKHVDPALGKDDDQYSVGQAISAIQCNWDGTPDPVLHNFFLYHFPDKTTRNKYFAWDVVYGRNIFECLAPATPAPSLSVPATLAPSPSPFLAATDCIPGQCHIFAEEADAPSVDARSRGGSLYFTTIGYDPDDRNCYRYLTFTIGDTLLGVLTSQPVDRFSGSPRMSDLLAFWTSARSPLGLGR